jgi:hypothetical protein
MIFGAVSPSVWKLRGDVRAARRQRLLQGPSYEEIVASIARETRLVFISRERLRRQPAYFRASITLHIKSSSTVDLFHNSARGYRAQYYRSIDAGKCANAYALKVWTPRVIEFLTQNPKRTCPPDWVAASLSDCAAKVWIYQGLWLRQAKKTDRLLWVQRWVDEQQSTVRAEPTNPSRTMTRGQLALWGALAPKREMRIDVKGGFLRLDGTPLGMQKLGRSKELHELGFT